VELQFRQALLALAFFAVFRRAAEIDVGLQRGSRLRSACPSPTPPVPPR
jgi:hypothetical protein